MDPRVHGDGNKGPAWSTPKRQGWLCQRLVARCRATVARVGLRPFDLRLLRLSLLLASAHQRLLRRRDIELEENHITILHEIGLAFLPILAFGLDLVFRAQLLQVREGHHLRFLSTLVQR